MTPAAVSNNCRSLEIRVRGRVQGVGFRPTVWRIAERLNISGEVLNDPEGVTIRASGSEAALSRMVEELRDGAPPLARIDSIETRAIATPVEGRFRIAESVVGQTLTQVTPDAAICEECATEVLDPNQRRYRYPFTNCTHCGPRLSIVVDTPYDRARTTMAVFTMCADCRSEYDNPADRRFHAEAIACPACGPQAKLIRLDEEGQPGLQAATPDAVAELARCLDQGAIVALKGLGGYQLACDATNVHSVERLRLGKSRPAKPFALMARDLEVIRHYCAPNFEEERQLTSSERPIVLMEATGPEWLPDAIAPGLRTLGFMLPTTPLHLLLLMEMDRPLVMTSGNIADEPQITDDGQALRQLAGVAEFMLVHDREIAVRVDDSVVRVVGGTSRLLRRARGFAPAPIKLPAGFETAPDVLALGGDLKAAFCLSRRGEASLSPHQGDLQSVLAFDDWRGNLSFCIDLLDHHARAVAVDLHPGYVSSKFGRELASNDSLQLIGIQHHHAHVAACLVENGRPLDARPVLGVVLDGLGWGLDGTIWGGEFLLADYLQATRLGTFSPIPMIGGDLASRQPWRSLYAHLTRGMSWKDSPREFADLEVRHYLEQKPHAVLDAMVRDGMNAPLASSCGRLFDAVAAALGICREEQRYEGEAASRLEATIDPGTLRDDGNVFEYPFTIGVAGDSNLARIEFETMWRALGGDLVSGTPVSLVAAKFHKGLASAIATLVGELAEAGRDGLLFDTVALSGGCFQNTVLFDQVARRLERDGFAVLSHRECPASDGGLALGQAAIGAARLISDRIQ